MSSLASTGISGFLDISVLVYIGIEYILPFNVFDAILYGSILNF